MPKNSPKKIKFEEVRVRLAPSPTGFLHLGTARTALFNFIFARQHLGKFILRIEDTDLARSKPEYEEDISESLEWLGLKWDEFYRQSVRKDIYGRYIKKLLDENKAYYCFCSKEELKAHKEYLISTGQPPCYSGKCRGLSPEEIKKFLNEKKPFIIRFKTPFKKVAFKDLIRGRVEFDSHLIGDFSIAKNQENPLYNLAAVIDDFEMKISHVIRGEDHLSNTPKQILLQEALDLPSPQYAHLAMILGSDRSKLSKRHGAVSVSEYRRQGYLPETLINFMAFLGWNPGTEREIYALPSLIKDFSLENCQKSGAVFNIKRLDWINGFYIRQKSAEKLTDLCLPYFIEAGFVEEFKNNSGNHSNSNNSKELKLFKERKRKFKIKETKEIINIDWLVKIVSIYQERLKKLSEIVELTDYFFKDKIEYPKEFLRWKELSDEKIKNSLDKSEGLLSKIKESEFNEKNLEKKIMTEANKMSDRGELLWPLRVALTGKKASAGPFEIAEILGKKRTIQRIKEAIELIK